MTLTNSHDALHYGERAENKCGGRSVWYSWNWTRSTTPHVNG